MRDLLLSQLQDGHTAMRFVMLAAGLCATLWLAFHTDAKQVAG